MVNKKLGRGVVRSVPDPYDGQFYTDKRTSAANNQWYYPTGRTASSANIPIEYVTITALPTNTALVYICEATKPGPPTLHGYPLAAGESITLYVDNLDKVHMWIVTGGEGVSIFAIRQVTMP